MSIREPFNTFFCNERLENLKRLCSNPNIPQVSIGSVRDYCESADNLGPLANHQGDLKDIQRCWMLKSVLATCPPGSRLAEIGAGEPVVAGILSSFGYHVTVIDPYDGSGNGPKEFELFEAEYPDIEFKREYLGSDINIAGQKFDVIYSISVLEHVPLDHLPGVFAGIKKICKSNAVQLHAVDHVLRGYGSEYHVQMLTLLSNLLNLPLSRLWEVLGTAETDIDTYFLSAEAHNRWRGNTVYEEFPMRKCISVNFKGSVL